MFWRDQWTFANSIEYEYKFAGKYGAKGEKRAKKKKATPEQVRKQNQRNKEKKMRRLIKANFCTADYWVTLKYPKGTRKPMEEVKKDLREFLGKMRGRYKRRNQMFKFIYRIEIGERGGIHIHIIINRIDGTPETDLLIRECWCSHIVNYTTLYETGGYEELAGYIVKEPEEPQQEQLSLFDEEERKHLVKYSSSRNLVRPEPERKVYFRRTMEKIIKEGPEPTPGFWIDRDSVYTGINPYTGMSYLHYTEYRIHENMGHGQTERMQT